MERVTVEVDGLQLSIADLGALGVGPLIEAGVDLKAAARLGRADQVDDRLEG